MEENTRHQGCNFIFQRLLPFTYLSNFVGPTGFWTDMHDKEYEQIKQVGIYKLYPNTYHTYNTWSIV
jgi:hypothetical protein